MYKAIEEDKTQICQFGLYTQYFIFKTKHIKSLEKQIFNREDFMRNALSGIFSKRESCFDVFVFF